MRGVSLEKRKLEELVKVVDATLRSALQPCRLSRKHGESLVGKLGRGDDEKKRKKRERLDLLRRRAHSRHLIRHGYSISVPCEPVCRSITLL